MKETTKYSNYRFVGEINVDEVMPWFDFDKAKPWDEMEVPWVMENKVRREILIILASGPQSFDELHAKINFSPKPLLIKPDEYVPKVKYQWTKTTLENHMLNLEWYGLVKKNSNGEYQITFPVFTMETVELLEKYITLFAENWLTIIKNTQNEIKEELGDLEKEKAPLYGILIEKALEKLYALLKAEKLLPDVPNIKTLWAEQLRKIKFEKWVEKNF
ncbi:MAG: hypothetical protein EU539_11990 [Promethearchaeota archaeon]|nr:MAG: hypothetical protein EU539_11990 [Candidatus Lokiarchaeota archaeon]